jgi:hypothetical protein
MKKTLTLILILFSFLPSFSQVGSSCSDPYLIYPATTCNNTCGAQYCGNMQCPTANCSAYVTAAGSSGGLNPSCSSDNETTQSVIWMQVTATASSFTINNGSPYVGAGAANANMRDYVVYSGTCGSLTQIYCGTVGANSAASITGLTAGQTYYIMASPASGNTTATATNTCITSTVGYAAPGNACASAVNLNTNVTYTYTNAGSTANGPICSGSVENDTWYRWCAPANWPAGQQAYISVYDQVCNGPQGLQLSVWDSASSCPTSASSPSVICQNPGALTQYYYQWTAVANRCYYVTLDGYAGTACVFNITIGSIIVLPVELLNFTVVAKSDHVDLNWATASEINNEYFIVEKSRNGFDFIPVSKLDGAGNSTEILNYYTQDEEPWNGISYYRLKQTDFDGQFSYSDIVPVKFSDAKNLFVVQPNPSIDKSEAVFSSSANGVSTLRILDSYGRLLINTEINTHEGINRFQFDISSFAKGVYFVTLENEAEVSKLRIIKE